MPSKDKYTDPKLRDEVKEEIQASDKGGEPGQWSARKAQMMAKEYKKRGGDYNDGKENKDESQKSLNKWGEEDWQTKEGSGEAKKEDGSRKRYLPKKAWEQMDEKEKEKTDEKKQEQSKKGQQFVANTGKARQARKDVTKDSTDQKEGQSNPRRSSRNKDKATNEDQMKTKNSSESGNKRKRGDKSSKDGDDEKASNKKQKSSESIGSKHDKAEAPAKQGSNSRLPKKGQEAHWKAMPGWVNGKVMEVLKSSKTVDGKQVKASQEDPRIVLKSSAKSGKICVHKPDNVYFD